MPGYEVFGEEERAAINDLFIKNGGVLFAHGFDYQRNGIFKVREFEANFAKFTGSKFSQAVSSGSAAIKTALIALGVKAGDEVIAPAFTFIATIEAIIEVGATPVIADIDDSFNLSPSSVEDLITKKTKAIIAVHMLGSPCDMSKLTSICKQSGILLIEDVAQACGGTYKSRALGTFGEAGAFSFDAGKTIITGEGGMVVTDVERFFKRARAYHDHGHEYTPLKTRATESAMLMGFNYRMTELQGVIGIVQLSKIENIIKNQRINKAKLKSIIKDLDVEFRRVHDSGEIGEAIVFTLPNRSIADRFVAAMVKEKLSTKNIPDALNWHFAKRWKHIEGGIRGKEKEISKCWLITQDLLERSIALPIMVKMSTADIEKAADKLFKIAKSLI